MKYFKIIAIVLFSSVISLYSCNDSAKTPKQDDSKQLEVVDTATPPKTPTTNPVTTNPVTKEPAQNEKGVWHYTCSKGCAGGAGSAVSCDNCGGLLAHNTSYHSNANSTPTSSAPYANPPIAPAAAKEPSQNTAGVWHYTCGKGCAGGSGAADNCGTCGTKLVHNTAYH
ncbi:hypothetical protein [Psychroserpens jangbogonensis]|uniref:hypothetical protein n=1 Tax=Psychroserpens jangbogonensis TaxID=1484460 RepID=UPI00053DBD65|nr:hypothetical protein [Psychroserpens jangbogonensis]